ncbi:hypothetical protein HQ571_05450 [Candidatus Kuenenbacteria bacterium]|nr:hypothetical protein [Candidatus Kuenenbacteria bacterium]
MKRLIPLILILILLTACTPADKVYSISDLLAEKDNLMNQAVNIKGTISYKRNCTDCKDKYIFLTDNFDAPAELQNKIAINFTRLQDDPAYFTLNIGDNVTISTMYYSKDYNDCPIKNELGCFVFNEIK